MKKTIEKTSMSEHNFTLLCKNRVGKVLGKGVVNHEVGPKRNKSDTTSLKIVSKMDSDTNVVRRFPTNRIGRHDNTSQIVLIDMSRHSLCVTHITRKDTKVENFLDNLVLNHVFSLRRREGNRILLFILNQQSEI